MKVIRGISLFIIYPSLMLVLGFWGGVRATHFFYPGEAAPKSAEVPETDWQRQVEESLGEAVQEVSQKDETLSSETDYVLEEADVLRGTVVETIWRLPAKYVGMNREQFVKAMEVYESSPPLSEQERGFVSLEVLAFSRERVVVQMNYRYLQPGEHYYLAVMNHEVVVYLEDRETVYINTGIRLDSLPRELQTDIIQMVLMEDDKSLYEFLETYSS